MGLPSFLRQELRGLWAPQTTGRRLGAGPRACHGRTPHLVMTLACVLLSILLASSRAWPHKPFFIADSKASCKASRVCLNPEKDGALARVPSGGIRGRNYRWKTKRPGGPEARAPRRDAEKPASGFPWSGPLQEAVEAPCLWHRWPRGHRLSGPGPAEQQHCHPLRCGRGLEDADSPGPEWPLGPPGHLPGTGRASCAAAPLPQVPRAAIQRTQLSDWACMHSSIFGYQKLFRGVSLWHAPTILCIVLFYLFFVVVVSTSLFSII